MSADNSPMLLEQHLVKSDTATLQCSETSLCLSDDRDEIVLTRYIEHYSLDDVHWVERTHRVPVSALLKWMMSQGEALTVRQSQDGG